jgi:hypothetical protein
MHAKSISREGSERDRLSVSRTKRHLSALRTTPVLFKNDTCPLLCVSGIGSTGDTAARPRQTAARCTKSSGARGMACTDSEAYEDNQAYARSAISRACAGGEQHHETARLCVLPDRGRPHAEDTARMSISRQGRVQERRKGLGEEVTTRDPSKTNKETPPALP